MLDKNLKKKVLETVDKYMSGQRSGLFKGNYKPVKEIFMSSLGSNISFRNGRHGGVYISETLKKEDIVKMILGEKEKKKSIPIDTISQERILKLKNSCEFLIKSKDFFSGMSSKDLIWMSKNLDEISNLCKSMVSSAIDQEILELEEAIISKRSLREAYATKT